MSASVSMELQPHPRQLDDALEQHPSTHLGAVVDEEDNAPFGHHEFSLPPADGGKDAWLFLAACFLVEALVWGFPFSFGVFQDYYLTHEPFAGSSGIPVIGTCSLGIMYMDFPLNVLFQRSFPRAARWAPIVGLLGMCVSLAASSFAQTTAQLIATQGVLYAIAGSICYCPCLLYLEEWFIRRKGLAYSIMWSGTGLGGFSIPLVLEFLLDRYGFRTTLRVWAVGLFVLTIPLVYFIKPRLPRSATTHMRAHKLGFLLDRTFLVYSAGNVVEAFGYFVPAVYLPTYARTYLGVASFPSAVTVLITNVASVIGILAIGFLADKIQTTTCLLISTVGAALGVFLLWGFATNLATLYAFCVVYGLFAGSYVSSYSCITRDVVSRHAQRYQDGGSPFDPVMILGFLSLGRGIGNVASGPLSELLMKSSPWKGSASGAWGSGYGSLIAFTGATAVLGGASFVWKRLGWIY